MDTLAASLSALVKAVILPPGSLVLLMVAALALWVRRPRLARRLLLAATVLTWVLSLPLVAGSLLALLQSEPLPRDFAFGRVQAIVVLGAGRYRNAPEYQGDTANALALERLRYAAWLQRKSGLPVLVSGGSPDGDTPEALFMKTVLEQEFGVPVRWVESGSRTTWENARESRRILAAEGIDTILLVTHAWHMPRARYAFEQAGFRVVPAGTRFHRGDGSLLRDVLPDARALQESRYALHELIGLIWYRLRAQTG